MLRILGFITSVIEYLCPTVEEWVSKLGYSNTTEYYPSLISKVCSKHLTVEQIFYCVFFYSFMLKLI